MKSGNNRSIIEPFQPIAPYEKVLVAWLGLVVGKQSNHSKHSFDRYLMGDGKKWVDGFSM